MKLGIGFVIAGIVALAAAIFMLLETNDSFSKAPLSTTWPGYYCAGIEFVLAVCAGFAAYRCFVGPKR